MTIVSVWKLTSGRLVFRTNFESQLILIASILCRALSDLKKKRALFARMFQGRRVQSSKYSYVEAEIVKGMEFSDFTDRCLSLGTFEEGYPYINVFRRCTIRLEIARNLINCNERLWSCVCVCKVLERSLGDEKNFICTSSSLNLNSSCFACNYEIRFYFRFGNIFHR